MGCHQEGLSTTQLKTRAVRKHFCLNKNGQRSARQVVDPAEEKCMEFDAHRDGDAQGDRLRRFEASVRQIV
jgi:hypothetical protein